MRNIVKVFFIIMESKDLQKVLFSKRWKGEGRTKIFRDLSGGLCLKTVKQWCEMIHDTGSIDISNPPGCPRIIRTPAIIQKVKDQMCGKRKFSNR